INLSFGFGNVIRSSTYSDHDAKLLRPADHIIHHQACGRRKSGSRFNIFFPRPPTLRRQQQQQQQQQEEERINAGPEVADSDDDIRRHSSLVGEVGSSNARPSGEQIHIAQMIEFMEEKEEHGRMTRRDDAVRAWRPRRNGGSSTGAVRTGADREFHDAERTRIGESLPRERPESSDSWPQFSPSAASRGGPAPMIRPTFTRQHSLSSSNSGDFGGVGQDAVNTAPVHRRRSIRRPSKLRSSLLSSSALLPNLEEDECTIAAKAETEISAIEQPNKCPFGHGTVYSSPYVSVLDHACLSCALFSTDMHN
ncbi:hypothetical protein THAOC_09456, partial [Thalassiosira oceanica]